MTRSTVGGGDDRSSDGEGDDLFIFSNRGGATAIIDFEDDTGGQDFLDVSAFFINFAAVQAAASASSVGAGDLLIQLDANDTVLLLDLGMDQLTAQDFIFA